MEDLELKYAYRVNAIDVKKIYIGGEEAPIGKKIAAVSPLKKDADNAAIVRKINELIAGLKVAGQMENKAGEE
ncbi:hypothetical protein [Gorillibacterium sp. CAU 1737]|uniref:hypothetical protein n=1 Tax=Gorillibacterium sp. CAU 1737 TaxID=3140362 RepID=UPI0032610B56